MHYPPYNFPALFFSIGLIPLFFFFFLLILLKEKPNNQTEKREDAKSCRQFLSYAQHFLTSIEDVFR